MFTVVKWFGLIYLCLFHPPGPPLSHPSALFFFILSLRPFCFSLLIVCHLFPLYPSSSLRLCPRPVLFLSFPSFFAVPHLLFIPLHPSVLLSFLHCSLSILLFPPSLPPSLPPFSCLSLLPADTKRLRRLFPRRDRRPVQLSPQWAQSSARDWATWGMMQQSQNGRHSGYSTRPKWTQWTVLKHKDPKHKISNNTVKQIEIWTLQQDKI